MKIFIGYEEEYPEMFEVCKKSILRYNSNHEIIPLRKSKLENDGVYWRAFQGESTDFAFTRFLVPYLCNYEGNALFCDGDFLWYCDPEEIKDWVDDEAVSCVQHPWLVFEEHRKMKDKTNRPYKRKYWSSLMYFNNTKCKTLTKEAVSVRNAAWLHEMDWAESVGSIPAIYNAMINYYDFSIKAKAVHFTDGGPWLDINDNLLYSTEWIKIYNDLLKTKI